MAQPLAERLRPKTLDDYIGRAGPGGGLSYLFSPCSHLLLYLLGASGGG